MPDAQPQEFVVNVGLIREERVPAMEDPVRGDPQGIEDGDGE